MEQILVLLAIFMGVFTQSVSGFGSALVCMAILPQLLGIQTATPLVALVAATIEIVLLVRYRSELRLRAIWRLTLASIIGIPFGIFFLKQADERIVLAILGIVIASYAVYALLNIRLPEIRSPAWAYPFGFLAGMLGGAYNTSGPLAIIYADCQRWEQAEFKSNLQGFFLVSDIVVVGAHLASKNLTPGVWQHFFVAVPILGLAILLGTSLDRFMKPSFFRRIVLIVLVVMGARLALG